jgi:hypothetical protein
MRLGVLAVMAAIPTTEQASAFTCHLSVGTTVFTDGPCQYEEDVDGSFRFFDAKSDRMFIYVEMDGDGTALGYWPGPAGGTHAHDNLGILTRSGACWFNEVARVCAWR